MRFLCEGLTEERAKTLVDELGFLGVCDLVRLIASTINGSISLKDGRVFVQVKRLRKPQKVKST